MTDVYIPDDVTELDDEQLVEELQIMASHEAQNTLTSDQEQYIEDLREELLKRMSVGGEYADYE